MTHQAATVTVSVPADVCCRAALASYDDSRWHGAYKTLRPGHRYSGQVTVTEPGRRFEVSVASVDPLTGIRIRALGFQVTYTFDAEEAGRTRVEVSVEYTLFAAVVGLLAGIRYQAGNEILHRLAGMIALEHGWRAKMAV